MLPLVAMFAQTAGMVDGNAGQSIADWMRRLVGPIFAIVVGTVAIAYLMTQQLSKLFQFMLIAIVVAALLFVPDLIQRLGGTFAGFFV